MLTERLRSIVDWEHPATAAQGANYLALLSELRAALPSPRSLLTTALPTGAYVLKHLDLPALAEVLDYLNLMAYDFTGAWTEVSGHHAQLLPPAGDPADAHHVLRASAVGGLEYLAAHGFPAGKTVLGLPAYARYFPGARAAGHPFGQAGEMEYCDLPGEWVGSAAVDGHSAAASWVDDGGKGFVSFDVPETARIKARYVKAMSLAGIFYWTGTGDQPGEQSLVAASYEELNSGW